MQRRVKKKKKEKEQLQTIIKKIIEFLNYF